MGPDALALAIEVPGKPSGGCESRAAAGRSSDARLALTGESWRSGRPRGAAPGNLGGEPITDMDSTGVEGVQAYAVSGRLRRECGVGVRTPISHDSSSYLGPSRT